MAHGGIDVYASRRTAYFRCRWWKTDESAAERDLEHLGKPSGIFYAKPSGARYESDDEVAQAFMFDGKSVTLQTTDNVKELATHCLVEYCGRVWIVQDVQRQPVLKTAQCSRFPRYETYLRLRA